MTKKSDISGKKSLTYLRWLQPFMYHSDNSIQQSLHQLDFNWLCEGGYMWSLRARTKFTRHRSEIIS